MDSVRLFSAMIFAVSVFLLYDAWVKEKNPPVTAPVATNSTSASTPVPTVSADFPPSVPEKAEVAPGSSASNLPTIRVETDVLIAEIDPVGGGIRRLQFTGHRDKVDGSKDFVLFDKRADHTYVAQSGLLGNEVPNHNTVYRSSAPSYVLAEGQQSILVKLVAEVPGKVEVSKELTFERDSFLVKEVLKIRNLGTAEIKPFGYFQLLRDDSPAAGDSKMVPTYTGAAIFTDATKFNKLQFSDIAKEKAEFPKHAKDGWIAILQHYFVAAWLPQAGSPREYYVRTLGNNLYTVGVIASAGSIPAGASGQIEMRLYAGPQVQDKLATLSPGLELTVDYGWLTVIAAPLFWVLSAIQKWSGNWGIAIVLLTVIIKLIFFPLSAASYRSMAKMRVAAPKMQKLKEQYGDDRQKMHQAMIEMYKTEKINPLGGCLPVIVQIPVFIALYWVLLASVELRNAPFFGWITDLSAQDPYYILPVLMGATMIIQTWLNPVPPDPVQAKVMKIMPVVFSVFFFFFPAGLVLYWLVNNILSIAQQWQITRMIERSNSAHGSR
ncbi:MAG: membrane protein insertase YidC [Burkholderiales bacterium]